MGALRLLRPIKFIFALAMGVGACNVAFASDISMPTKARVAPITPAPAFDPWTFSLTPYGWATSLSGFTTIKGHTTDINASFFDILDHTQFPKGLFQGASAGFTYQMVIAEAAAAYEVARWGTGTAPGSGTALDVYAGGRLWWQEAEATLTASGTLAGLGPLGLTLTRAGTVSASGSVTWVDPVVGARLRHQFFPGMNMVVSGDVGGFGAGSKFSWQAIAALDYQFMKTNNVTWSGMIGYKALYVDYSQGSGLTHYEYDMTMYGPIFGITARF
jgi:hypothetical protein